MDTNETITPLEEQEGSSTRPSFLYSIQEQFKKKIYSLWIFSKVRQDLPSKEELQNEVEKARQELENIQIRLQAIIDEEAKEWEKVIEASSRIMETLDVVESTSTLYNNLKAGKRWNTSNGGILDFDLDNIVEETQQKTESIENPISQEEIEKALKAMQEAQVNNEQANNNYNELIWKIDNFKQKKEEITKEIEIAKKNLEGRIVEEEQLPDRIAKIEMDKKVQQKKIIFWGLWWVGTIVAWVLIGQAYEWSKKNQESWYKEKRLEKELYKESSIRWPKVQTERKPPKEAPVKKEKEKKIEAIEIDEKFMYHLDSEIRSILREVGYEKKDNPDIVVNATLSTLSNEYLKKLSEAWWEKQRAGLLIGILEKIPEVQKISQRKDLMYHLSNEVLNGTLIVPYTPELYEQIFVKIEPYGWSTLKDTERMDILERVLYRDPKKNPRPPQKNKDQAIKELINEIQRIKNSQDTEL